MGTILSILLLSAALQLIPFMFFGWLLKGRRPYLMTFVGLLVFTFILHAVPFHWLTFILQYLLGMALYAVGAKIRTGKSTEAIFQGEEKGA
jgi:hypothetical protein